MAVWCTNTSGARSGCEMNPKPLAELNHLTVPMATLAFSLVPLLFAEGIAAATPEPHPVPSGVKLAAAPSRLRGRGGTGGDANLRRPTLGSGAQHRRFHEHVGGPRRHQRQQPAHDENRPEVTERWMSIHPLLDLHDPREMPEEDPVGHEAQRAH